MAGRRSVDYITSYSGQICPSGVGQIGGAGDTLTKIVHQLVLEEIMLNEAVSAHLFSGATGQSS